MEEDTKVEYMGKIKNFFDNDKYKKIIIICGIVGIALIFVSNIFDNKKPEEIKQDMGQNTTTEYKKEIEESLTNIITKIDGAGVTQVLVTVDCGTEFIYAADEKLTNDISNFDTSENKKQLGRETTYLKIKLSDGTEQVVALKEIQPKIRGVLVVCSGGESSITKQRVLEAVTKALDISSAKVCITKLSE